jgi:hypothetical protein
MIVGDLIYSTGDTTTVYRVVDIDMYGSIVALPVNATAEELSSLILQPADVTYFAVNTNTVLTDAVADIIKNTDDITDLTASLDAVSTTLTGALVTIADLETRLGVVEGG